jgi:hypothetical protein
MSLLRRLFGRRKRDAMDEWRAGASVAPEARPDPSRAPDAEPEDVPYRGRIGFDGRPIDVSRGGLTGLEGGNAGGPTPPGVPQN